MNQNDNRPFFSILIPSFDRPEKIVRAIESISTEECSFEIIVSDDCSPKRKEISDKIKPYIGKNNFSFFQQEENLREPSNKNFLIEKAIGEYNIFLGDDDYFEEGALDRIYRYIKNNPNYQIYCFGYNTVNEKGKLIESNFSYKAINIGEHSMLFRKSILFGDIFPLWAFHTATFCCKHGIEKEFLYKSDVGMAEDLYFLFENVLTNNRLFVIPEIMFNWVKVSDRDESIQVNQSKELLSNFKARAKIYNKIRNSTYLDNSYIDRLFIESRQFQRRFLFQPLVLSRADKELIYEILAKNNLTKEFNEYLGLLGLNFKKYWTYPNRFFYSLRTLGPIQGMKAVLRKLAQKTIYKIKYGAQ